MRLNFVGRAGLAAWPSWLLTDHVHAADGSHLLCLLDHRAAVAAADRDEVPHEAALNALLFAHLFDTYTQTARCARLLSYTCISVRLIIIIIIISSLILFKRANYGPCVRHKSVFDHKQLNGPSWFPAKV